MRESKHKNNYINYTCILVHCVRQYDTVCASTDTVPCMPGTSNSESQCIRMA